MGGGRFPPEPWFQRRHACLPDLAHVYGQPVLPPAKVGATFLEPRSRTASELASSGLWCSLARQSAGGGVHACMPPTMVPLNRCHPTCAETCLHDQAWGARLHRSRAHGARGARLHARATSARGIRPEGPTTRLWSHARPAAFHASQTLHMRTRPCMYTCVTFAGLGDCVSGVVTISAGLLNSRDSHEFFV